MMSIDFAAARLYCKLGDNTLASAVSFVVAGDGLSIVFTDDTVYGTGDSENVVNLDIYDHFGGHLEKQITAGTLTVNISTLNTAEGLDAIATVVSTLGKVKDGTAFNMVSWKITGTFTMEI